MDQFDSIWEALAKGGHCDAPHGAEYERVRKAWFAFGYFNHLWQFIIASANAPATFPVDFNAPPAPPES